MRFTIEHLRKRFDDNQVLKDITFTFKEGRIYGLLGRNGAGKTTLFNCLNGDLTPEGGAFWLERDGVRSALKQREIGYVLSTPTVPEFLTGREFLKFFLDINRDEISEFLPLDTYFDMMSIAPADRDKLMRDYSHGMKNKMQMLVNLIAAPSLLLLDEPLTSLDVVVAEEMKERLREQKEGRVTIFSTHILDLALDLCDDIVLLNHGVLEELPRETISDSAYREKILTALRDEGGNA